MWEEFDGLEVLQGSPVEKWKDVIFNASRTLASLELERLLELQAIYEIVLEESELEGRLKEIFIGMQENEELYKKIKHQKNNIAIESTAKILSENE